MEDNFKAEHKAHNETKDALTWEQNAHQMTTQLRDDLRRDLIAKDASYNIGVHTREGNWEYYIRDIPLPRDWAHIQEWITARNEAVHAGDVRADGHWISHLPLALRSTRIKEFEGL